MSLRTPLLLLSLGAISAWALGCSPAPAEEDDTASASGAEAFTAADDEFTQLLPVLRQKLEERQRSEKGAGGVGTASLAALNAPAPMADTTDACNAVGAGIRGRKELPMLFAFAGASASAAAILQVTTDAETVWDLTHQQEAVFVGREYALTPGASLTAGAYAGLGLIDVELMMKHGDTAPGNVVEAWSGDYFGAAIDIQVPFKFLWAEASCITDKPGVFFACGLGGGVGIGTDLLPLHGSAMKGSVAVSPKLTIALTESSRVPHVMPLPLGEFNGKKYPYSQFKPVALSFGMARDATSARAAISMLMSMPLPLAVAAAPLALAAGVDQDLIRTHGVSLAVACANKRKP